MAKTRILKRKKTKRIYKPKFSLTALNIGVIFLLILIFVGSLIFIRNQHTTSYSQINYSVPLNMVSSKNVKITPSPTPSTTPSPTQVPLTGYCLRVPVLMYHHIQPESTAVSLGQTSLTVDNGVFAQQMAYLSANGYTTLWASDLAQALINHTSLPAKSVVITMDDGYADNHTYALPIIEQYHFKANLMLATGLVDSNPDMLTWAQIQDMKNSGLYYFTNHTWSHWPISRGPQTKIQTEISTAQNQINQYTGQNVNIFTYPYGSFNSNAIETLQQDGYIAAFTEIPGFYQCDSFIMTLHRTRIGNVPLSAYGI